MTFFILIHPDMIFSPKSTQLKSRIVAITVIQILIWVWKVSLLEGRVFEARVCKVRVWKVSLLEGRVFEARVCKVRVWG